MKNVPLLLLLAVPAILLCSGRYYVRAQEEDVDDGIVEEEDSIVTTEEEIVEEKATTASKDVDTMILFTEPVINPLSSLELPAGKLVEFLISFINKGEIDYIVESVNTSFRYPMDFSFYIQNFSTITYNKVVKPNHEVTLAYSFIPSEVFAGRPFGLNVNLNYKDVNDIFYNEAVFNETVQIIELDEGLDGETIFLYVFLVACVVLLLVIGQQLLSSFGRKSRSTTRKTTVEVGTANPNNVDYQWISRETKNLNLISKSPKTPRQSPRQRKAKRSVGSDD